MPHSLLEIADLSASRLQFSLLGSYFPLHLLQIGFQYGFLLLAIAHPYLLFLELVVGSLLDLLQSSLIDLAQSLHLQVSARHLRLYKSESFPLILQVCFQLADLPGEFCCLSALFPIAHS